MNALHRLRRWSILALVSSLLWGCASVLQPRQALSFVVQNKSSQWLDQVVIDLDDDARLRHLGSVRPGDYQVEVGFNRIPSRAVITWTTRGSAPRTATVPVRSGTRSGEKLWSLVFEIRDQELTVLVATDPNEINKGNRVIYPSAK